MCAIIEISEYRNHLCEANRSLLAEIEEKIPVVFEKSNDDCWLATIRKTENCGVVYCKEPFADNKIAHELLHIKMGLIMGDNSIMLQKCDNNALLKWLFIENNAAPQILNAYEHLVILPMYENMGFDKNDFFEDQDVNSYEEFIDKQGAEGIRHNGKISVKDFITLFACTMSYMFFPIDNRFQPQLSVIKRTERDLYSMFKNFKIKLQKTPLNNQGKKQIQKVYSDFMGLLDRFIMRNCDTNNDFFRMFSII
jgi:hypothetical protein